MKRTNNKKEPVQEAGSFFDFSLAGFPALM
jgi:hypothetical protein